MYGTIGTGAAYRRSLNRSGSSYSINGRPLGVQLGQKSGTSLFGGGGDPSNFFAANVTGSQTIKVDPMQMVVKGIQDEIDHINGYRTNLSVAEKQQLADLQTKISKFNDFAQGRSLTQDEISERSELYVEAYRILGKDYVNVASDEFLTQKTDELTALMANKPTGADAARLETLQNLKTSMLDRIESSGQTFTGEIYYLPLRNVQRQIDQLTAPRDITELSPDELRQHDEIADAINEHAGQELQLKSDKRLHIARLQKTMELVQQGVGTGVNILA